MKVEKKIKDIKERWIKTRTELERLQNEIIMTKPNMVKDDALKYTWRFDTAFGVMEDFKNDMNERMRKLGH